MSDHRNTRPVEAACKRVVMLPNGTEVPAMGLGTWRMGESTSRHRAESEALAVALELGYRLFDTAEMYGGGGAESLLGHALTHAFRRGLMRDDVFVVSKALPENADTAALVRACEDSLRRLQLDRIDLYLLHWRSSVPLRDTIDGFEILQRRGLIRYWGVSNFDTADLRELLGVPGGTACAANQVWYSLSQRGIERDLLPCQRPRQMPLMAYSPLDQGDLIGHPALTELAERHQATPAQVALAWLLHQPGVMTIPKAASQVHLRENLEATRLVLTPQDLQLLDAQFPRPLRRVPLAVR